jgi:hypothetical protein
VSPTRPALTAPNADVTFGRRDSQPSWALAEPMDGTPTTKGVESFTTLDGPPPRSASLRRAFQRYATHPKFEHAAGKTACTSDAIHVPIISRSSTDKYAGRDDHFVVVKPTEHSTARSRECKRRTRVQALISDLDTQRKC